jgi:DNA modification methylase
MQTDVSIICGDCRDVLPTLSACSVNVCVTSPPYYGLRDYGHDGQIGLEETPEEYIAKMVAVFREVRRVLRDDGTLWLNLGDSYASVKSRYSSRPQTISGKSHNEPQAGNKPDLYGNKFGIKDKDLLMIPARVAIALQADGWYLRSEIVWHKPNPMPESVKDRPTKSHEMIYLFSKSKKYYYDADAVMEDAVTDNQDSISYRKNGKSDSRKKDKIDSKPAFGNAGFWKSENGKRNRRDVWTVNTSPYKGAHFATFPPKLIDPCILAGCPVGGVVLDPFHGAGTTGLVAAQHGRGYIGIELNQKYIDLSIDRLSQVSQQQTLI